LQDAAGRVLQWFGTNTDITDRKQAEDALRESEERLTLALSAGRFATWDWRTPSGKVVWNDEHFRMLGYEVGAVTPSYQAWVERIHPEDRPAVESLFGQALKEGGEYAAEFRSLWPDGTILWVEARGRIERDPEGRATRSYGVMMDITERKQAEAVLARSKEELEVLVRERTAKLQELVADLEHFSYTITHDMRAPLRGMIGFSEMMSESCAGCKEHDSQGFLRRIRVSAARMDALIRDALNYGQAVRRELPLEAIDLGALLRGMLDSYPELQATSAQIRIEGDLPLVLGNEAALTQCFSNLLGNAVKFAKPGQRPEIRIWAESSPGEPKKIGASPTVRICVEDNGLGIPESFLPRVFDMFARGQNTHEGTGIGLALVRKVVQRMEGKVGVESEVGKGSRFWVDLQAG
jgi:PAS domain S-box-containing protein